MLLVSYLLFFIYCLSLTYITVFCLLQFQLLWFYKKNPSVQIKATETPSNNEYPFITIQLPIFNEQYVIERLLDNITKLDYPKDRFEIQVLDDSTDDSVLISQRKVKEYQSKGFDIKWIHRTNRTGYKAGALKAAMLQAKGDFIAIFDADFLPRPDFLKVTMSYFNDPAIGLVQTRWEHINEDFSLLTRLQAMQLNVHFTIEQQGRQSGNCLLQFNGTAGVWRRICIDDAGGWEADTLTEDLDLSYRAQLKGWKIHYLEQFGSPAELPAEMNGLKSQQFRWMKGGAENARKLLPTVWKSNLNFRQKIHATGHLMGSGVFICIFISAVISVPLLFAVQDIGFQLKHTAFFFVGLIAILAVYYVANVQAELEKKPFLKKLIKFIFLFPVFLALSMGLSLHNTIAVIQGYLGKQSPFIRTPKFNIKNIKDNFKQSKYLHQKIEWTTIIEGFLTLYFMAGIGIGIYLNQTIFVSFHTMLMIGFGAIFWYSIAHRRSVN